jgi:hypothetical protein
MFEICGGCDNREVAGYQVCKFSAARHTSEPLKFTPLREGELRFRGLYNRPHEHRNNGLWCPISNAPMATSFANSRFLTQWVGEADWVLWMDFCDMLFLADPVELFKFVDPKYAVMVVKHNHNSSENLKKMDDQIQTSYSRKNWSSLILWNRKHPSNFRLTLDDVDTRPGRDLHRFFWLEDDEIGSLPIEWNWLVGVNSDPDVVPKLLHYTLGSPELGVVDERWGSVWLKELEILRLYAGEDLYYV